MSENLAEAYMVAEESSVPADRGPGASGNTDVFSTTGAAAGGGAGGRATSSPSVQRGARQNLNSAAGSRLYEATLRDSMEETGLRRRRRGSNNGERDPDPEETKDTEKVSSGLGLWGLLTAPVRVPVQIGRAAIMTSVSALNPFSWLEMMFHWVSDVTPDRLKRLSEIIVDAFSHITGLSRTQPGHELGYAFRNVVDSFVETLAAPKGREAITETAHVFVRCAEAFDTPEAHAAYAQITTLMQRICQLMATEEAGDLMRNANDFVSRLAHLANSPESTVAVAEFVTTINGALEDEHRTFRREQLRDFVPFPLDGADGMDDDDLTKKKEQQWAAAEQAGIASVIEDEFTLGKPKAAKEEDESKGESMNGGGGARGPSPPFPPAAPEFAEPSSEIDPSTVLPDWDAERRSGFTPREVTMYEERRRRVLKKMGIKEAVESGVALRQVKTKKTEAERAMTCAASFIFFATYTVFALVGVRSTVRYLWGAGA